MEYNDLENLAATALSSPFQSERENAANALRGLTSYDSFPFIRKAIVEIPDESLYSCVLLCKALRFVVLNELGPSERQEMQSLALGLVARKVANPSFHSPPFILKSVLSIYAAGLFLNFRLMLFGSKENDGANRSSLGEKAIGQLSESLDMKRGDIVMMAMTEVILHFNSEEKKNQTVSLRRAFATEILPSFFAYAVSQIHTQYAKESLELSILCLELVPSGGSSPLINLSLHTDESLYLHPASAWLPPLRELALFCSDALVSNQAGDPLEPNSLAACSHQILRLMSCAVFTDWRDGSSLLTLTDGFFKNIMPIATMQFKRFTEVLGNGMGLRREDIAVLEHSIALMVNIFERNDLFVGSYVYNNAPMFFTLASVAHELKVRMLSTGQLGEENILGKILHLFYVIGERGIPPLPQITNSTDLNSQAPADEVRGSLVASILSATTTYLETIVETAHLAEENYDLSREGFMLNLDNILTPMAEMLFSDVVDVISIVDGHLSNTLRMHALCARIRSDGPATIDPLSEQSTFEILENMCNTMFGCSVTTEAGLLLVTKVVLSRLAVLIALIGLSVKLRAGRSHKLGSEERLADQSLAMEVMNFIATFISPDHTITDMMLLCMNLEEVGGCDGNASRSIPQKQLHVSLLRSLIYFCGCLHETWISRHPQFLEITSEMLSFALIEHGDCYPLASDANNLVKRLLEEHTALTSLPAIKNVLEEHWNCNIMLTRNDFTASDPAVRKLRSRTLTNIVKLSEARADVQLQQFVPQIVKILTDEKDFELFVEDVTSVVEGVTYAISLYSIVSLIVEHREMIVTSLMSVPEDLSERTRIFSKVIKCWGTVAHYCCRLLESDNVNECLWSFASFCFDSLSFVVGDLQSRYKPSIEAGRCLIPEQILFDGCSIIVNTLKGKWCNLGVMLHYGDRAAIVTFTTVMELVVSTPVQVLMSDFDRSPSLFSAIYNCLTTAGLDLGLFSSTLVRFLTKCMEYRFYDLIARCILVVFEKPSVTVQLSTGEVSALCSVALVTLTTSPLEEHEVLDLCEIIIRCYKISPETSETVLNSMLDSASAYHRVRVRSFLTLLRNGAENAATKYIEIFGTESTVVTISGW